MRPPADACACLYIYRARPAGADAPISQPVGYARGGRSTRDEIHPVKEETGEISSPGKRSVTGTAIAKGGGAEASVQQVLQALHVWQDECFSSAPSWQGIA